MSADDAEPDASQPDTSGPAIEPETSGPASESDAGAEADLSEVAKANRRLVAAQNTHLDALRDRERSRATLFAGDVRLLVQLGDLLEGQERWTELEQFVDLELAGTLVLGRTAASNRFCDAVRIVEALPLTLRLLEAGALFVHQALMLLRKTRNCPVEVSRLVESRVLPDGATLCPADLGRRVEAVVLTVEGERGRLDAEQRRAAAVRARRTFVRPAEDGMAVVGGVPPSGTGQAVDDRVGTAPAPGKGR